MDRAEYDALPALNWSRLKLLERSPAHFRAGWTGDSSGFALGTAAHAAILEPARFAAEFVVYPGKVRRGKEWDAFEAEALAAGQTCLSRSEHADAQQIGASVRSHLKASSYLDLNRGKSEVALVWQLGEFQCKGRADYVSEAVLTDLKSTRDASPRGFAAACQRYGYFGQAAWYSDGLFLATGVRRPFVFVAVESSPPYVVQVYTVPEHVLAAGREQYLALLGRLDYCQRTGWWGGYTEADETEIQIPTWRGSAEEHAE